MKKKLTKWNMTFQAMCILLGAIVGLTLFYVVKGDFNISVLFGFFVGAILLTTMNFIKVRIKKDATPDVDERIMNNMLKYFSMLSYLLIGLSIIGLTIATLSGIEQISISLLWIPLIIYLSLSGFGAFIVSRR